MNDNIEDLKKEWNKRYKSKMGISEWPSEGIISFALKNYTEGERKSIKVLDFGCGVGNNLYFLLEEGFDAYGSEISSEAIYKAGKKLNHNNKDISIEERIRYSKDGFLDSFPNEYFDLVIDRESLSQMEWGKLKKVFKDIKRVMKKNAIYYGEMFAHTESSCDYFKNRDRHFFSLDEIKTLSTGMLIESVVLKTRTPVLGAEHPSSEYCVVIKKI